MCVHCNNVSLGEALDFSDQPAQLLGTQGQIYALLTWGSLGLSWVAAGRQFFQFRSSRISVLRGLHVTDMCIPPSNLPLCHGMHFDAPMGLLESERLVILSTQQLGSKQVDPIETKLSPKRSKIVALRWLYRESPNFQAPKHGKVVRRGVLLHKPYKSI